MAASPPHRSCPRGCWPLVTDVKVLHSWTAHVRVTQSWHTGDTCEGDRREGVTQLHMAGLHMCTLVLRGLHVLVVPARAAAPG
eukprot:scaffold2732_cov22-Tisochrysis_lutea.AAC.4